MSVWQVEGDSEEERKTRGARYELLLTRALLTQDIGQPHASNVPQKGKSKKGSIYNYLRVQTKLLKLLENAKRKVKR